MIWYKFEVAKYLEQTLGLSNEEDLAYRRLLDLYHLSERPLPLDIGAVARHIRAGIDVTTYVLDSFFDRCDDGYRHPDGDRAIERYRLRVATNAANLSKRRTASEPKRNPD